MLRLTRESMVVHLICRMLLRDRYMYVAADCTCVRLARGELRSSGPELPLR